MRRRKINADDSMELLLDTICNIFGGIIFMAILVVIQTQISAGKVKRMTEIQSEQQLEASQLQFECSQMEKKVVRLQKRIEEIKVAYRETPVENIAMLDEQSRFLAAFNLAVSEQERLEQKLREKRDIYSRAKNDFSIINKKVVKSASELEKELARLDDMSFQITETIRLPRRHQSGSERFIDCVVKEDQVYLFDNVNYWGSAHISGQCRVEPCGDFFQPAAKIIPLPASGFRISKEQKPAGFLHNIQKYSSGHSSFNFFVFGNSASFSSFQTLKNMILDMGYSYAVCCYGPDEDLIVHPAASIDIQ